MSTKTLRKRISLVAVAALGFGVVTGVSAHAAADAYFKTATLAGTYGTATVSGSGDGTSTGNNVTVSAVIGGIVDGSTSLFTARGNSTDYKITNTGVGTLFGLVGTDSAGTTALIDAANSATGITWTHSGSLAGETVEYKATSEVVGTQVIYFRPTMAGTTSVTATLTINWLAASSVGLSDANTVVYAAATCGGLTSRSAALASQTANSISRVAKGSVASICAAGFDVNGVAVSNVMTVIGSTGGGTSATAATTHTTAQGTPTITGTNTYTVILTDGVNVVTRSIKVDYMDVIKTITLGNATYAAAAGGNAAATATVFGSLATGATDDIGTPSSKAGALVLIAKDKNGNLTDAGDAINPTTSWTVDSDAVTGTPSAGVSDASAIVTMAAGADTVVSDLLATHLGGNGVRVSCGSAKEKLTITANSKDSTGTAITSNAVTFYCAGAVDKITVDSATAGKINVMVSDAKGYPVADGTSVTLAASNGSVVAPSTKATEAGKFATAATFIASSTASKSTVTAIVGSKSGVSADIAGTGTSSNESLLTQIDALNAKIVALNALIAKIMKKLGVK